MMLTQSQEGVTRDVDGRDKASELPSGTYHVAIHLQGVGLDEEYGFRLENPGGGDRLRLELAQSRNARQPNNPLKLTRRATLSWTLESPAGLA